MLYWALMFLVFALIAGVLGFTGIAIAAAGIAKLLFVIFLVFFIISLATHLSRRGSGTTARGTTARGTTHKSVAGSPRSPTGGDSANVGQALSTATSTAWRGGISSLTCVTPVFVSQFPSYL